MNYCKISEEGEPLCWVISSESACEFYQPCNSVGWQNGKRRCKFEERVSFESKIGAVTKYLCSCGEAALEKRLENL